jgi:hypothetical protein
MEASQTTQSTGAPSLYQSLAAPFDVTFRDHRGGVELEYITGEQTVTRLNEVLGPDGWSFRVLEHGYNEEADEEWVLGEIAARVDGAQVLRQQFGSQKIKRSRSTSTPLDIGFDLKGAATDSLKKCASLLGVGLYLSRKEAPAGSPAPAAWGTEESQSASASSDGEPKGSGAPGQGVRSVAIGCVDCGEPLKETKFKDGAVWSPAQLAAYGRRKHGRVLCMTHYREANEAVKRAQSLDAVPF